jgi:prepilin peptidase CpaA
MMLYSFLLLGALLLFAAYGDIKSRTIPNWLNIAIALTAPLAWWEQGLAIYPDITWQIGVAVIIFAVFAALFYLGSIGGGDVKMVAAMALWIPAGLVLSALMVMALVGGGIAAVMLIDKIRRKSVASAEVPYGVAIAAAGFWAMHQHYINQFSLIPTT